MYDDTPLYARGAQKTATPRFYKTAASPSPIVSWFNGEDLRRSEGRYNEIDGNEIKAALRGVKNVWFKIAQEHRTFIEEFFMYLDGKRKDYTKAKAMWHEIKQMEKNKTNATKSTNELATRTRIQSQMAEKPNHGLPSPSDDAQRGEGDTSDVSGDNRLMATGSACLYLEAFGMANTEIEG